MNLAIIRGNVGQEPKFGHTQNGKAYCSFTVATSSRYKNRDGEWVDNTQWHNVQTWNRLAEVCGEYVTKGKSVLVQGRIEYRENDGKYYTYIVADNVEFLASNNHEARPQAKHTPEPEPAFDLADNDLPF